MSDSLSTKTISVPAGQEKVVNGHASGWSVWPEPAGATGASRVWRWRAYDDGHAAHGMATSEPNARAQALRAKDELGRWGRRFHA